MLVIKNLAAKIKDRYTGERTGHDWFHIERVWEMARYIGKKETTPERPVNMFIVEAASLLHEIGDFKLEEDDKNNPNKIRKILAEFKASPSTTNAIKNIVHNVSFKGARTPSEMKTIEGQIVQDADRLDAMGAIGIARAFTYGGSKKRPLYDSNIKPYLHKNFAEYKRIQSTTINHFYEKLLFLKDRLHTKTAKRIAKKRHAFMKLFLKRFFEEWQVKK